MEDLPIGPITEARIAAAFAEAALITAQAVAQLLGVDEKTLRALADCGRIRVHPVGKSRRYTEAAIRHYLASGPDSAEPHRPPKRGLRPTEGGPS